MRTSSLLCAQTAVHMILSVCYWIKSAGTRSCTGRSSTGQIDGVCHHLNSLLQKGVGRREGRKSVRRWKGRKRTTRSTLDCSISCRDLTCVMYSSVTLLGGGGVESVNNLEYFISEQHCHLGHSASFIMMVFHLSPQVNWDSNCSGEQLIHPQGKQHASHC